MQDRKWLRWLGVIGFGVAGSAAWELAVRPLGDVVLKLTLNIVTLGIDSLRDGLYADAARGSIERVSAVNLSIVSAALVSAAMGMVGFQFGKRVAAKRKKEFILDPGIESVEKIRESIEKIELSIEKTDRKLLILQLIAATFVIVIYFLAQRAIYVNGVVSYFQRMYEISAPYLAESERLQIRSQFYLIRNRADYLEIVEQLQTSARQNNVEPPPFQVY